MILLYGLSPLNIVSIYTFIYGKRDLLMAGRLLYFQGWLKLFLETVIPFIFQKDRIDFAGYWSEI
jgi:hypothetical protein